MRRIEHFENMCKTVTYMYGQHPRKVGTNELMEATGLPRRTQQRAIKDLIEYGYFYSDGCNPRGYTCCVEKIEHLMLLRG